MMSQPTNTSKREDDRLCAICGYPINKHTPEQKIQCSKHYMRSKLDSPAGVQ